MLKIFIVLALTSATQ